MGHSGVDIEESIADVWLESIMAPPGCAECVQPGGAGVNMTINVYKLKF